MCVNNYMYICGSIYLTHINIYITKQHTIIYIYIYKYNIVKYDVIKYLLHMYIYIYNMHFQVWVVQKSGHTK